MQSELKFQTRSIAAFCDKAGFVVGSIEGRCAVTYISGKGNFAFKCHRRGNDVFCVNSISAHPQFNRVFATAGSDGDFCFWDAENKRRLKEFKGTGVPITVGKFNRNGTLYAYARCYDWSKGVQGYNQGEKSSVLVHVCQQSEVQLRK